MEPRKRLLEFSILTIIHAFVKFECPFCSLSVCSNYFESFKFSFTLRVSVYVPHRLRFATSILVSMEDRNSCMRTGCKQLHKSLTPERNLCRFPARRLRVFLYFVISRSLCSIYRECCRRRSRQSRAQCMFVRRHQQLRTKNASQRYTQRMVRRLEAATKSVHESYPRF